MKIYIYIKAAADFIMAAVLLILLFPLLLCVSALLLITLRGNPFFTQTRPGLHGKPFKLLKFKTMLDLRDIEGNLLPDLERMTRLGILIRKYSIDELPQLWNVLKGDMSFIGPRPLLMEYLPLYSQRELMRHNVRPGITGLAQVKGRNAISWKAKFKYDVYYVEHQTFSLDLKIICWTCNKVLKADGVNASATTTMIKYNGRN